MFIAFPSNSASGFIPYGSQRFVRAIFNPKNIVLLRNRKMAAVVISESKDNLLRTIINGRNGSIIYPQDCPRIHLMGQRFGRECGAAAARRSAGV